MIVTSDIRSSHSSDGENNDLTSPQTVRVKRTIPKDIIQKNESDNHESSDNDKSMLT